MIKTQAALFSKLVKTLKAHHPYEVPEIVSLRITNGNRDYLRWITRETSKKSRKRD